jgi:hypothetical protein
MKHVGPILLVSIIDVLYVTSAFVVFDWDQSWRRVPRLRALGYDYEVGFKTY